MKSKIKCLDQTTVVLEIDGKVIYFDPISAGKKADVIIYSGKVFSKEVFDKICKKKTVIYGPSLMKEVGGAIDGFNFVNPKEEFEFSDFKFEVIPAYKLDRLTIESNVYNGYILKGSESFYFAGPTDLIPEMNVISVDFAIIPVSGECMDLFEAVASTNVIDAKTFVPVSYMDDSKVGLSFCVRFTRKSFKNTDLFRLKSILPDVSDLNDLK